MSNVSCMMIVEDAHKTEAEAVLWALVPSYSVGFLRKVCALDPNATWETPATHHLMNEAGIDNEIVLAWQNGINGILPTDPLPYGEGVLVQSDLDCLADIILVTGTNISDFPTWNTANMTSEGLQFVPNPPL